MVDALLHYMYDQPDDQAVHTEFDRVVYDPAEKLRAVAERLKHARADILVFTLLPQEIGAPDLV